MFLQIGSAWVRPIGDPHLGKTFKNGVPLERRGEREDGQRKEFMRQLMDTTAPDGTNVRAVIMMGDLFDGFNVSNDVVLQTFKQVAAAANRGLIKEVEYILLMGNHDVSRNLNLTSSFDLLQAMAFPPNVHIVKEITSYQLAKDEDPILLCPYDAFKSTVDLFSEENFPEGSKFGALFGPWDTQSCGGSDHNLLPYYMCATTDLIVTGHEHNPKEFMRDQTKIIVTGSLLPYSFAEDAEGKIYVTKTLSEFEADPQAYSDKCLRLVLKKGEEVPENISALQLQVKYVNEEKEEEIAVVMEDFSMKTLFNQCMAENNVSEETAKPYWEKYENAQQD